jgi:hypothetical protein
MNRAHVMDLSYWEAQAAAWRAATGRVPADVAAELERFRAQGLQEAEQAELRLAKLAQDFFRFDDAGVGLQEREYRAVSNLRALALFSEESVESVHQSLLAVFEKLNSGRRNVTRKFQREEGALRERQDLPATVVKAWLEIKGYARTWSRPGPGEKFEPVYLRPETVPANCLVQLTKDWVCVRDGKITGSKNVMWDSYHGRWSDQRAVNGIWVP